MLELLSNLKKKGVGALMPLLFSDNRGIFLCAPGAGRILRGVRPPARSRELLATLQGCPSRGGI